jgi:hypothetical protein
MRKIACHLLIGSLLWAGVIAGRALSEKSSPMPVQPGTLHAWADPGVPMPPPIPPQGIA